MAIGVPGTWTLQLEHGHSRDTEMLPLPLLHEAINALPDGDLRTLLITWSQAHEAGPQDIAMQNVADIAGKLLFHAHEDKTEAGRLGRMLRGPSGLLVDANPVRASATSAPIALALVLRRWATLNALNSRIRTVDSSS